MFFYFLWQLFKSLEGGHGSFSNDRNFLLRNIFLHLLIQAWFGQPLPRIAQFSKIIACFSKVSLRITYLILPLIQGLNLIS